MANMFANAKAKAEKKPAAKKKSTKREVDMAGLEHVAQLDMVIKAFGAMKDTLKAELEEAMLDEFVEDGTEKSSKPESFRGVEGRASASCELRKRSSRSVLTDAEIKVLEEFGVDWKSEIDTPETYVINPAYAKDENFLASLSEKLGELDLPEDFIQFQDEKSRKVTTENSLDQIFKINAKPSERKALVKIAGTLALKPTLETNNVAEALGALNELFAEEV